MTVFTRDDALQLVAEQGTAVVIPDGITVISRFAFLDLEITSVTLPDGLLIIGGGAFSGNKISELAIPDTVQRIEGETFSRNQIRDLVIPDSVRFIGEAAFFGNKISQLSIGKGLGSIGEAIFENNSLLDVLIPGNIGAISTRAFASNLLKRVEFQNGNIIFISEDAFAFNKLEEVVLPKTINEFRPLSPDAFDPNVIIVFREPGVIESPESVTLGNDNNNIILTGNAAVNGIGNGRANILEGNDARNKLKGKNGKDIIIGNQGGDVLSGGKNSDTFVYRSIRDSGVKGKSRDVITDFSDGDAIDLSRIDAQPIVRGNQTLEFIGAREFTDAGQVRFENGILSVNTVNDLNADFQVKLKGVTELFVDSLIL